MIGIGKRVKRQNFKIVRQAGLINYLDRVAIFIVPDALNLYAIDIQFN